MAESQPSGRPPWWSHLWPWLTRFGRVSWWRSHWLALTWLGVIVLLAYAVLVATVLPGWVVSLTESKADENHRLDAIANARGALLGVLAPVVLGIGAVAALLNYRETSTQNRRTLELASRRQVTARFTRAIGQLGKLGRRNLHFRLGGIYALEQISQDSSELHWPVMEVLTAFLREGSKAPTDTTSGGAEIYKPPGRPFHAQAYCCRSRSRGYGNCAGS